MKLVVITFIFSILTACNNDASGVRVNRGKAKKIDTDSLSYDAVVFSSSPYCGNNKTSSGPISEASFGEEESDDDSEGFNIVGGQVLNSSNLAAKSTVSFTLWIITAVPLL